MTRASLLLALVACGGSAKPATTPTPPVSNATPTPTPPPAPPAGDVHHDARGIELAKAGKLDEAAVEYIAEIEQPNTEPTVFAHLDAIYKQLSVARRTQIAALGTKDKPIRVPDIGFEYTWVAKFGCVDGEGRVGMQALVSGPKGELDRLDYKCPDGSDHGAYFDFSDDPTEKAMKQELGIKH